MMTNKAIPFVVVCSFSSIVRAMTVTRYMMTPAPVSSDISSCGEAAGSSDFCAARVTSDNTCEPLTRDWCKTKDMSMGGSYLVKQTIKHVPENTYMFLYDSPVPMYMSAGSEVEVKFVGRSNWNVFRCNLRDANKNIVLHVNVKADHIYMMWKYYGSLNSWQDYNSIQPLYHYPDVEYTLTIRCDVNSFQIFRNGIYIWTYNATLPITSISDIDARFVNMDGEIQYVAFKAGQ